MLGRRALLAITVSLALLASACGDDDDTTSTSTEGTTGDTPATTEERSLREVVGDHFEPLPGEVPTERDKVLLGRALFHDRRLSGDETLSCATCHMLTHGGAEPRRTSTGIRGQTGPINSPSVLNAAFNFRQFWDGRAADLREQAAGPVTNPIEMGGEWTAILERLRADEALVERFTAVYGEDALNQENVIDAIVAYESYLVTPSPFDRWLAGQDDALNEPQQRGLRLFVETGCTTCHNGRNVGGAMYQRMGLVNDYFERRGGPLSEADRGRFNVTQDEADRHMFKVPTLRNVTQTSPYFHDGSEPELSGAVRTMAYVQLNRELTDEQVADIVAFLGALEGELPPDALLPDAGASVEAPAAEGAASAAPTAPAAPPAD